MCAMLLDIEVQEIIMPINRASCSKGGQKTLLGGDQAVHKSIASDSIVRAESNKNSKEESPKILKVLTNTLIRSSGGPMLMQPNLFSLQVHHRLCSY